MLCMSCICMHAQEKEAVVNDTIIGYSQSLDLELELLDLINKGADANIISDGLKDTILQFILYSRLTQAQILKDKITISKDTNILYPPFEYTPRSNSFSDAKIENGINSSLMLPDKLPVPERESRNSKGYFEPGKSMNDIRRRTLSIDYFAKGIDGYYTKLIEMGYVGEGWIETKEIRELMARIKAGLAEDIKSGVYVGNRTPEFVSRMRRNKNPLMRALGGILQMLHNGTNVNYISVTL